jgi:hypothetical protein
MAPSRTNLPERLQLGGPRRTEEAVPRVRTDPQDTREASFQVAKSHRTQQRRELPAKGSHRLAGFVARIDCRHKKNRGAGKRCRDRLGDNWRDTGPIGRARGLGLHQVSPRRRAAHFTSRGLPPALPAVNGGASLPLPPDKRPFCRFCGWDSVGWPPHVTAITTRGEVWHCRHRIKGAKLFREAGNGCAHDGLLPTGSLNQKHSRQRPIHCDSEAGACRRVD